MEFPADLETDLSEGGFQSVQSASKSAGDRPTPASPPPPSIRVTRSGQIRAIRIQRPLRLWRSDNLCAHITLATLCGLPAWCAILSSRRGRVMSDQCCRVSAAGSAVCEFPAPGLPRPVYLPASCQACGTIGRPVQGQTVKSLLAVSLRAVRAVEYRFCPTANCPVVYFVADGDHGFTVGQVRERVYQKEPDADDVKICYCFGYTAGDVRRALPAQQQRLLSDIEAGIQAGQCACDLRNPQGSCCLGNVRRLIKQSLAPGV